MTSAATQPDSAQSRTYTVRIPEEAYLTYMRDLFTRRLLASPRGRQPLRALVQCAVGLGIAAACFQFEPSRWLGWSGVIYAGNALVGLATANAMFKLVRMSVTGVAIALLSLMWVYTWPLAVLALAGPALFLWSFAFKSVAIRYMYRQVYKETVECGFDEQQFWLRMSDGRTGTTAWSELSGWSCSSDWVVLHGKQAGAVFFPVAELKRDGEFDRVVARARANASGSGVSAPLCDPA